jgi:hypothetical protein
MTSEPESDRLKRLPREPDIYDVAELPESEKGGQCPMYVGEEPERCTGTVEFVAVYENNLNADDDRRGNYRCCANCKPRVTADDGLRADGSGEPSVEELVERELRQVQGVAKKIGEDPDDLSGAMIVVANDEGIETYPYVAADEDPREMSLWMLGAFMAHVADSASGASGRQMRPIEAAQHAAQLINDPEPDHRGDQDD